MYKGLVFAMLLIPAAGLAQADVENGDEILSRATNAAGGEVWRSVDSLYQDGTIQYFSRFTPLPRSTARYQAWREFDRNSESNHPTQGRARVRVSSATEVLRDIRFLGAQTNNDEQEQSPDAAAWENAFALELIRVASENETYQLFRLPNANVDGHLTYTLRVVAPTGQETIASIDKQSLMIRAIRTLDKNVWRERIFDDFRAIGDSSYMQPYSISVFANGALVASVKFDQVLINEVIDPEVFADEPSP